MARTPVMTAAAMFALLAACSSSGGGSSPTTTSVTPSTVEIAAAPETAAPTSAVETTSAQTAPIATDANPPAELFAGAASRSVLPTVNGTRDYLADAPGWDDVDPFDPGVFVEHFDQGKVDVGNGDSDASWVHDDLRATAVAIERGDMRVVLVTADLYMVFAVDSEEIEARALAQLPPEWQTSSDIVIAATHNHEGPDSAFSVNDDWYDLAADEIAGAIVDAVDDLAPATMSVASGEHRFGVGDARDPIVIDPALRVLALNQAETGEPIATIVQWASHPETTLGFEPSAGHDIAAECLLKEWQDDDCQAEGRYFTADYPGVLRERLSAEIGGEVLYFNGAIGSQIGPGESPVWQVDAEHPVGDGWTPPQGAQPVAGAADMFDENFATTEAIGDQLAVHVLDLLGTTTPVANLDDSGYSVQPFYSRMTNIGFRVLLADGDLGWQIPDAYLCTLPLSDATCRSDGGVFEDDPVLTPLVDSQVRKGDVLKTKLELVHFGDVAFLFMPGELPPELVIGLPADWATNSDAYYESTDPLEVHARGDAYAIPGYLHSLLDTDYSTAFTVGLGGDELGYWVPLNEVQLRCAADILGPEGACQAAYDAGVIDYPNGVGGALCKRITDDPSSLDDADPELAKVAFDSCRYGQALGRELGEPPGHYEETNSAGWDLVGDTWAAAVTLLGRDDSTQINPDNPGFRPSSPPPAS